MHVCPARLLQTKVILPVISTPVSCDITCREMDSSGATYRPLRQAETVLQRRRLDVICVLHQPAASRLQDALRVCEALGVQHVYVRSSLPSWHCMAAGHCAGLGLCCEAQDSSTSAGFQHCVHGVLHDARL